MADTAPDDPARDGARFNGQGTPEESFLHDVFISYGHEDRGIAERISSRLRTYRPPRASGLSRKLRVFRDVERLTAGASLDDLLVERIEGSRHLVLLLSPDSAASEHVNREVETFIARHGPGRLRLVLLRGELDESLPPALRPLPEEPLFIDLRGAGRKRFRDESLRLIASLFGVDYDRLRQQDRARRRRQRVVLVGSGLVLVLLVANGYLVATTPAEAWEPVPQPVTETWSNALMPIQELAVRRSDPETVVWLGRNARHAAYLDNEGDRWTLQIFDSMPDVRELAERAREDSAVPPGQPLASLELEAKGYGNRESATIDLHLLGIAQADDAFFVARGDIRLSGGGREIVPMTEVEPRSWLWDLEPEPAASLRELGLAGRDLEGTWIQHTDDGASREMFYSGDMSAEAREVLDATASEEHLLFSNDPATDAWLRARQEEEGAEDVWESEILGEDGWIRPTGPQAASASFTREEIEDPTRAPRRAPDGWPGPTARFLSAMGDALRAADHYSVRTLSRPGVAVAAVRPYIDSHERIQQPAPVRLLRVGDAPWRPVDLPTLLERIEIVDVLRSEDDPSLLFCVTDRAGVFRSRDAGATWQEANFGEATLRGEGGVRLLLAPGPTVYALALLHDEPGADLNPLFRLERRDLPTRWRVGLSNLLAISGAQSPADVGSGPTTSSQRASARSRSSGRSWSRR